MNNSFINWTRARVYIVRRQTKWAILRNIYVVCTWLKFIDFHFYICAFSLPGSQINTCEKEHSLRIMDKRNSYIVRRPRPNKLENTNMSNNLTFLLVPLQRKDLAISRSRERERKDLAREGFSIKYLAKHLHSKLHKKKKHILSLTDAATHHAFLLKVTV